MHGRSTGTVVFESPEDAESAIRGSNYDDRLVHETHGFGNRNVQRLFLVWANT